MTDAPKAPEKKEEKPATASPKTWIQKIEKEVRQNSLVLVILLLAIVVLLVWK